MKAMILEKICTLDEDSHPLRMTTLPEPIPGKGESVIKVSTCGVCHTELDEIEGRTPPPVLPMVLGHQAVGRVAATGPEAERFETGDRVGVAWIFSACGSCEFCKTGRENLCASFMATGRDANGGYAEYMRVPQEYPLKEANTALMELKQRKIRGAKVLRIG
jgi:propanol-preferring alcohol dehydrogenase